jgi:hypothetical protein
VLVHELSTERKPGEMNQMSQQTLRQVARRRTREMAERHRRKRAEKERRVVAQAEVVMIAIGERDAAIAVAEARAAAALRELVEVEGLTVREAVEWCGGSLDTREANRLRRRTPDPNQSETDRSGQGAGQTADADAGTQPSLPAGHRSQSGGDTVEEPTGASVR